MNEQMELVAEKRSVTGKQVKRLRQQGVVPAIVYGHNVESVPVQVKHDELVHILRRGGRTSIFQLKMGRQRPFSVAIKQLHVHPINGHVLHADFYRVAAGEKLKMKVPLHFEGEAPVLKTHEATLVRTMNEVQVECLPADLPSQVPVDLTRLDDLGTAIRVGDLTPIDKVVFLDPADEVIVSVAAAAKEAEVAEKAAETAEAVEGVEPTPTEPAGNAGETGESITKAA